MKAILWRLKNLGFFLLGLACLAISGKRARKIGAPKKVVVIQGAKLGDIVCTTPVFRAIKKTYPDCKVVVVGDSVNQKLLEGHKDTDRYIIWNKNFFETAKEIKKENADYGMLMLPSLEGLTLLIASKIPSISVPVIKGGQSPYETKTYRFLAKFVKQIPHYFDHYVPREYLRLLEPIKIFTEDTTKHLSFTKFAAEKIYNQLLQEKGDKKKDLLVGILPGVGGDPIKRFAPEKFARLADYLTQKHKAKIFILGAGRDKDEVLKTIANLSPDTKFINLFGKLTIDELKALIASLSLFISADTGPIYIAEAFGTPTIDILGPVKEFVQPPQGKLHKVAFVPRERGMLGVLDNIAPDHKEAKRQTDELTVEMVTKIINEMVPVITGRQKEKVT